MNLTTSEIAQLVSVVGHNADTLLFLPTTTPEARETILKIVNAQEILISESRCRTQSPRFTISRF